MDWYVILSPDGIFPSAGKSHYDDVSNSFSFRPRGWTLPIRDVQFFMGAGFMVPIAGAIKLMPGTASDPAYRRIDVDTDTGRVTGLF